MYNKEEILETVCEGLLNGKSLRKICLEDGMPNKSTILRWLSADDEFATIIARARDLQAEALFDDMTDIVNDMLDQKVESNAAKTAIWAKQWQASKLKPKKYGDSTTIKGDSDSPLEHKMNISAEDKALVQEYLSILKTGDKVKPEMET